MRIAVECLPIETKQAMLDGLEASPIIVGAYTDRSGGVCPMLAAHRSGGRTSFSSFARAWDRYTHAGRGPRPATERELSTLRSMLETGLAADEQTSAEFDDVIAQHKRARARSARELAPERVPDSPARAAVPLRRDTNDRNRFEELRKRHGWAWLRLFRRYDDYAAALRHLDEAPEAETPAEPAERERV
ncbi:MAG: hypothetical protein WD649_04380 [Thermoleophilaceae bacterium]